MCFSWHRIASTQSFHTNCRRCAHLLEFTNLSLSNFFFANKLFFPFYPLFLQRRLFLLTAVFTLRLAMKNLYTTQHNQNHRCFFLFPKFYQNTPCPPPAQRPGLRPCRFYFGDTLADYDVMEPFPAPRGLAKKKTFFVGNCFWLLPFFGSAWSNNCSVTPR